MTGEKVPSDTKQGKSQGWRFQGRRPEEGRINIPMLKYGKGIFFFSIPAGTVQKGVKRLWRFSKVTDAKQVLRT